MVWGGTGGKDGITYCNRTALPLNTRVSVVVVETTASIPVDHVGDVPTRHCQVEEACPASERPHCHRVIAFSVTLTWVLFKSSAVSTTNDIMRISGKSCTAINQSGSSGGGRILTRCVVRLTHCHSHLGSVPVQRFHIPKWQWPEPFYPAAVVAKRLMLLAKNRFGALVFVPVIVVHYNNICLFVSLWFCVGGSILTKTEDLEKPYPGWGTTIFLNPSLLIQYKGTGFTFSFTTANHLNVRWLGISFTGIRHYNL